MESNTVKLVAVALVAALVAGAAAYSYADQAEVTLEEYEDVQNELETLQNDYATLTEDYNSLQSTLTETQAKVDEEREAKENAEEELARYVKPVVADFSANYEVNRSAEDEEQYVEDEFTATVNEAAESFDLELGYDLVSEDSIDLTDTAESITVYDGNYVVGEVTDGFKKGTNEEDPVEFTATVTTTSPLNEFEGDYRVEIEHHFELAEDTEGPEVRNVEFTASDTSDYFIYLE